MTYSESAREESKISAKRCIRELKDHGCVFPDDWEDFQAQYGKRSHYTGDELMNFLGY